MKYKLMIKTHLVTNLKYLCVTTKNDYHSYKGSGTAWKKHLKENGNLVKTNLIFETDDKDLFFKVCKEKSAEYDVVNSPEWANLIVEHGSGEYLYDEDGKRIFKNVGAYTYEEREEWNSLDWYECSVCGARMTGTAFKTHKKCSLNEHFEMIKFDINEWKKQFIKGDKNEDSW